MASFSLALYVLYSLLNKLTVLDVAYSNIKKQLE